MVISSPVRNKIALAALCLASLMFGLEISSVPVILPILESELHGNFKDMQWIMNAYTIACTTVLMATGTLADRYGRRRVFIISLTIFGLTSLICGLAQNIPLLIISRFLQGIGGGAMFITLIAILSHQFQEGQERAKAFATWGIISGIGLGFGPIIGGMIVSLLNWQWVFLIHVPLSILAFLLVLSSVEESRDPNASKLDIGGIITLSITVFSLVYFITQGPEVGFTSGVALGTLAVSAISFIIFIVVEKLTPYPMFDFSVFRIRSFSGALLGSIGMSFSFWPFMIFLPIYFQSALGYDIVTAGLSLLAYTIPTLIVPPLAERLSLRYQPRVVIPSGLFVIGAGFLGMKYGSGVDYASWLTMLPGSLLAGIGLSLINTPVTNTTTGSVSRDRAGMASGIDMSARLITLAINIAMMGFILQVGILAHIKVALPQITDDSTLKSLAEKIASGGSAVLDQNMQGGPSAEALAMVSHDALINGFGLVMLYGGLGVWLLAAFSFVIFGSGKPVQSQVVVKAREVV